MAASHGGILYYVVPVPREDIRCASSPVQPSLNAAPRTARPFQTTDSGWDNPFRPDGDLSREADEIVELIKGGKPITPTPGSTAPQLPEPASAAAGDGKAADGAQSPQLQAQQQQQQLQSASPQLAAKQASPQLQQQVANSKSAAGAGANGNAPGAAAAANAAPDSKPAAVEVQRGTVVQPSDASQVEHVVIKKKPKCKCCVIQ